MHVYAGFVQCHGFTSTYYFSEIIYLCESMGKKICLRIDEAYYYYIKEKNIPASHLFEFVLYKVLCAKYGFCYQSPRVKKILEKLEKAKG